MIRMHQFSGFALISILLLFSHGSSQKVSNQMTGGKLRLVSNSKDKSQILKTSGVLEIKLHGKWFRFCDSEWGRSESYVACGQLGFTDSIYPNAPDVKLRFDMRDLPDVHTSSIRIQKIKCDMAESQLTQCRYHLVSDNATLGEFCPSGRPVVLDCAAPTEKTGTPASRDVANGIRLRGGTLPGEGQVQVLRNGKWGGICANLWNLKSANVACRQLGFGTAKRFYTNTKFGQNHGWRLLNKVACIGNEKSLTECRFRRISRFDYKGVGCSKREIASVSCHVPNKGHRSKINLLDGSSKNVGRVVVRFESGNLWGSICSDYWSLKEAAVACRQMGLGYAYGAYKNVRYVTNSSQHLPIAITQVRCRGDEESLSECKYNVYNQQQALNCGNKIRSKSRYVGVVCSQVLPDLQPDANALQASIELQTKQLYELECAASENCLAPSAYQITNKNSTRKLLRFTMSAWNRGTTTYRPKLKPQQWLWHECHGHFHSMAQFAHYDILSATTLQRAAEGHKASFCLGDSRCEWPARSRFRCTREPTRKEQGISVGCTDIYQSKIDCQWIDITDVPPGRYLLRVSCSEYSIDS